MSHLIIQIKLANIQICGQLVTLPNDLCQPSVEEPYSFNKFDCRVEIHKIQLSMFLALIVLIEKAHIKDHEVSLG